MIVRIFLVSARTHSISRYIHIQTLYLHKRNVLRFLQHGTYHVVRGGSHFCQLPKGGGSVVFLIKTQGRANTFLGKKYQNSPALPPPQEKTYLPLWKMVCFEDTFRRKICQVSPVWNFSFPSSNVLNKWHVVYNSHICFLGFCHRRFAVLCLSKYRIICNNEPPECARNWCKELLPNSSASWALQKVPSPHLHIG